MSSKKIAFTGMLAAVWFLLGAGFDGASAYTFKTLHVFCTNSQCPDGWGAEGAPIANGSGALFGVTGGGGNSQNSGTIYELVPKKSGKWKFHTLYTFCFQADCADGNQPRGTIVADVHGNLYGTTQSGGKYNEGVVFEFTPRSKKGGALKVLYDFCAQTHCPDGYEPSERLTYAGAAAGGLYDGVSPLYGVAAITDTKGFAGIVYQLTPGKTWTQSILYRFCSAPNCSDGELPTNLVMDANGDLLGEAMPGTSVNLGTVFELAPSGTGQWTETTLYQFCTQGEAGCQTGTEGAGPLLIDSAGNLYDGGGDGKPGNNCPYTYGCGTLFKIVPNGVNSTESVLYYFCKLQDCKDGLDGPKLVMDSASNIFGETDQGGGNDKVYNRGAGTVFQFTGGAIKTLYAFCTQANCADGATPLGGLTIDASGDIFGATYTGGAGAFGKGTIFELVP
jgi:uncharacterized repeat protein (TIGR03803 family)